MAAPVAAAAPVPRRVGVGGPDRGHRHAPRAPSERLAPAPDLFQVEGELAAFRAHPSVEQLLSSGRPVQEQARDLWLLAHFPDRYRDAFRDVPPAPSPATLRHLLEELQARAVAACERDNEILGHATTAPDLGRWIRKARRAEDKARARASTPSLEPLETTSTCQEKLPTHERVTRVLADPWLNDPYGEEEGPHKRWGQHRWVKEKGQRVAAIFRQAEELGVEARRRGKAKARSFEDRAEYLEDCAKHLGVKLHRTSGEPLGHIASCCRDRFCPWCNRGREHKNRARMARASSKLIHAFGGVRFVMLTLTDRNVPVEQLREHVVDKMGPALKRLLERQEVRGAVQGYGRWFEVTRGRDGNAHPHLHLVLAVHPEYFQDHGSDGTYLTQQRWQQLWRESLQVDYDPVVDVRAIRPNKRVMKKLRGTAATPEMIAEQSVRAALAELAKYAMKLNERMMEDPTWFLELCNQLVGIRQFSAGGWFKAALRGAADELEAEKDQRDKADRDFVIVWYRWTGTDYVPCSKEDGELLTKVWLARIEGVLRPGPT